MVKSFFCRPVFLIIKNCRKTKATKEFVGTDDEKEKMIDEACREQTGWSLSTMSKRTSLIEFFEKWPRFLFADASLNELGKKIIYFKIKENN